MKVRALVASHRVVAGRRDGGSAMRSDDGKLATRRRLTHSLPARHTFAMCPAPTCDLGMRRTRGSGPRPPAPSLLGGGIVHGLGEDCGILLFGWLAAWCVLLWRARRHGTKRLVARCVCIVATGSTILNAYKFHLVKLVARRQARQPHQKRPTNARHSLDICATDGRAKKS